MSKSFTSRPQSGILRSTSQTKVVEATICPPPSGQFPGTVTLSFVLPYPPRTLCRLPLPAYILSTPGPGPSRTLFSTASHLTFLSRSLSIASSRSTCRRRTQQHHKTKTTRRGGVKKPDFCVRMCTIDTVAQSSSCGTLHQIYGRRNINIKIVQHYD